MTRLTVRSLMSALVQTISPETSVNAAQSALSRYGHSGLCVVNDAGHLVGIVSRRDVDIAQRHGLGDLPVKGWMSEEIVSISPERAIAHIHDLMTAYDVGQSPIQLGPTLGETPCLPPPTAETLHQTLKNRLSEIWPALMLIATVAEEKGWSLYLVGGAVRDLLLEFVPDFEGGPQALTDIDLVVEGASSGAGVALAEVLQAKYPQVSVQIYGQFQTAALVWPVPQAVSSAGVSSAVQFDIATARTEFYPYPAANPEVEASAIQQDLYRRDFAINAIAIRLNQGLEGSPIGHLLDLFDGWIDLQRRQVRVLHSNSFIEDPTRIFRAVRFATRLEFSIEGQTERFIRTAISSGVYARMQAIAAKTPALQSRLKSELKYLLQANGWESSLREIDRLGALACLDSKLQPSPAIWRQLRRLDRWLVRFATSPADKKMAQNRQPDVKRTGLVLAVSQTRWLILLELLLLQLPSKAAVRVASNLDLGAASLRRLENIHSWEAHLLEHLPQAKQPSQVYSLLAGYEPVELLLMGDRHPHTLGPQIWQYIVQLSQVTPLMDGATLKRLGLRPGPQFRTILTKVHQLTLDGELTTLQAAENYVLTHYAPS
ncbi:MAG: hypothetical protein DCF25_02920 [Leptolyngbya foveolarum]|uniref:CBS domain-containing protein n=1 Tax=Leptolyngbya foveolarum TaxID=47253 RepID=A0A2W4UT78_9CYAN|nr:MAG: hypothetical protein DCF25_02920 [Leptolyngbya foveolarum]